MSFTIKKYIDLVQSWQLNPNDVLKQYLKKAEKNNEKYNCFVRFHNDYAEKKINDFKDKKLCGAPISIKDIILTEWMISSCWSKMLENYVSPYSATCFKNLEKNWGLMIWKANMDQFAMWSSNENSYFWNCINPHWTNRISWWSSWGSVVSVASDSVLWSLWTDTWWSIRQPASLCWIVWVKPTYWRVSRYGVQSMWSSLDQVWTLTKTVEDGVLLLDSICWHDPKDATSQNLNDTEEWYKSLKIDNIKNYKIAVVNDYFNEWIEENVKNRVLETIETIKSLWATVEYIDFSVLKYALSVYYIIMPAEASTNLARFDWIRFWYSEDTFDYDTIYEYYSKIREMWFGDEVKRRIMIWTYVLSAWYYDAYYNKAQKVRNIIKKWFDDVFNNYDLIIWPVSPSVAWKIWEKVSDPLKMYLSDIYTVPINLAWLPAMSLPIWLVDDNWEKMPVWLHIIASQFCESKMFWFANYLEGKLNSNA